MTTKSKVFFIEAANSDSAGMIQSKLGRLCKESGVLNCASSGDAVAVKMHFGEDGNTGFVQAQYLRVICDALKTNGAVPFLSDTNTLYRGRRTNSADHLELAQAHGFTKEATGVDVIIPDDTQKINIGEVEVNARFIKTARVVSLFLHTPVLVGVAHFKGHIMTGFGGALKNIGMGCASREGKLAQHCDVAPIVIESNCVGCGACELICPVGAVKIINNKSVIDGKKCIGCASCIASCNYHAIDVEWESGGGLIQEKMVEYAKAILDGKSGKKGFINFATKITKECDCIAKDDPRICADIGIFASVDPVSIDKACLDKVVDICGKDIFKEVHPSRDGMKQLRYASSLGLGSLEYELIDLV